MIKYNKLKSIIKNDTVALGMFHYSGSPAIVEILGYSGFDFVIFDTEHTPFTLETGQHIVRAADASNITPLIRVENNPSMILKALDLGFQGVIIPRVKQEEEALRAVNAVKYPPIGERGSCPAVRASNYASGDDAIEWSEYCKKANEEIFLSVLVEGKEGISNLKKIASVEGVDNVFFGPVDLAQDLGLPRVDHPKIWEAVENTLTSCRSMGISVATTVTPYPTIDWAKKLIERGFKILAFSSDLMVFHNRCKEIIQIKKSNS